ncbi:MAG: 2-oxoacid:acceptor oxidoreductase family protein [Oscillospiraceae bacterium]|nr:2-oxoacid:acceptor oxidoreductase family protein [Oscillospiraceae bacterium]
MIFNCLIAGIGGQGIVLASKLLAAAAMNQGFEVRTTETIGMAQRGGSVVSHIRMGTQVFSPLIPKGKADIIIGFDPTEAVRQLSYLSQKGSLITYDGAADMMEYIETSIPGGVIISGESLKEKYSRMLNVALLGAATQSGIFPFDEKALLDVISEMPRYREENIEAFEIGKKLYHG